MEKKVLSRAGLSAAAEEESIRRIRYGQRKSGKNERRLRRRCISFPLFCSMVNCTRQDRAKVPYSWVRERRQKGEIMAEADGQAYQVTIPVFEGPLDLLLHLVTKNRIDIHDIPIHIITDQYLEYLQKAEQFNLELGSSFFTMASTLLLIKSRMLLPKRRQEEADDSEDPRQELTRSLEEFRQMKEVRARIESLLEAERPYRGKEPEEMKNGLYQGRISVRRLQAAFLSLYQSLHEEEETWMDPEEVSLESETDSWNRVLREKGTVSFSRYFRTMKSRLRLAVAFLALLEMIRLGRVRLIDTAEGFAVQGGNQ